MFVRLSLTVALLIPVFGAGERATVEGTWRGRSVCVGNRPACKDEEVVYRFRAVQGRDNLFTLYADKILEGKRVPMYKLDFVYDKAKGTLTGEFTRRQTHGVWSYKLSGDEMEGTLTLLPNKDLGRNIHVSRTSDDKVPEAPPLTEYEP